MISFIHTADVHFGMENYGKIDPQTGIHSRLEDFSRAFNLCIDAAIEHNVDFFLFAGDAYKTAHPSQTQQKLLMSSFLRLYKAGIPAIIVVGNHDHPLGFGKATALDLFQQLPVDGFHVISKPTTVQLHTASGPINIVGIPWPTRNTIAVAQKHEHKSAAEITDYISRAVAQIITQKAEELDPAIPAVLTGHLTVANGIFSGSEKRAIYGTDPVLLPSQLAIAPFDYVALGHLHRYQNLNNGGYPAVVYSGSIERIDFGERKEEKGFCIVRIPSKGNATHEFVSVPTRPFIQIDLTLSAEKPLTDQILHAVAAHDLSDAVVKIIYHIPPHTNDTVNIKAVQQACSSAMYVVGIIGIPPIQTRERRMGALKIDMSLETLLSTYWSNKPELRDRQEQLIAKALELAASVEKEDA